MIVRLISLENERATYGRNQPSIIKSLKQLDSTVNGLSIDTNNDPVSAPDALQLQNANRWSNSIPLRSGRNVKLPARFR